MEDIEHILRNRDTMRDAWNGIENPLFILTISNVGIIYDTLREMPAPLLKVIADSVEAVTYENMDYTFKKVYTLQNLATETNFEVAKPTVNTTPLEAIRKVHGLGRAMTDTIVAVSQNKEFQNAIQADGSVKEDWTRIKINFDQVASQAGHFEHIAYVTKLAKRPMNFKHMVAEQTTLADDIKAIWQKTWRLYRNAKDAIR